MPSLADLSNAIAEYRDDHISLDGFEDWFRTNSRGMFGEDDPQFLEACLSIEAAFSRLRFEGLSEMAFRDELADAIAPRELAQIDTPFVPPQVYAKSIGMVYGNPWFESTMANPSLRVIGEVD